MSADGSIELQWGDGTHRFRLAIDQIRELQDKCDAGPEQIMLRLRDRTWRLNDVRETIRLGLIGGKSKTPIDALTLVIRYVDNRPLAESVHIAFAVIAAAVLGVPEDQPALGKPETAPLEASAGGSASGASTQQVAH